MKFFAALTLAAVNGETIKCWTGETETVAEFTANSVKVECTKNEICLGGEPWEITLIVNIEKTKRQFLLSGFE